AQLNLSTLRVVGASHLMTWQLKQPRILEFVFENINLPDSISNEPGSHGFVEFEIQPNSDLPLGVTIKNRAAIYFDYNAPVITSYVTTPIATSSVSDELAFEPLTIAPNPATTLAQIQLPRPLQATGTLRVWQADGKNVHLAQLPVGATQWSLDLSAWVPGVYWLEIQSEGLVKWTGKLIKQ
ncbi:MAG: T9SS type A sorting domain-containing protein, partial [Saprospiraceae bacterium]|nr:T9SS type A sorting domain-containing protein [Saprospiraceae bacterium]